ncbi:MAG: hypothetical protein WCC37_01520 [Candidatus Sulfotelmatobacter sp.]
MPILLIHGLADDNILHQQSEEIRARNPADIALWRYRMLVIAVR